MGLTCTRPCFVEVSFKVRTSTVSSQVVVTTQEQLDVVTAWRLLCSSFLGSIL